MARELETENGVAESASAIWKQIQAEHSNILTPACIKPDPVVEDAPLTTSLVTPALTVEAAVRTLKFGSRPPSVPPLLRRREAPTVDEQFRSEDASVKKQQLKELPDFRVPRSAPALGAALTRRLLLRGNGSR